MERRPIQLELKSLKARLWAFYWALTLFMALPWLLICWLLSWPWSICLWAWGIFALRAFVRHRWALYRLRKDFRYGVSMRQRARIVRADLVQQRRWWGRRVKQVAVFLEKTLDGSKDERDHFVLWENRDKPFPKQDKSLRYRYRELVSTVLEIDYLPHSGIIISYRILDEKDNELEYMGDLKLYVRQRDITLFKAEARSMILPTEKIDFITFERKRKGAHYTLTLSSESVPDILPVPSLIPRFHELEQWMKDLSAFDWHAYELAKEDEDIREPFILWEREFKVGIPIGSPFSGMRVTHSGGRFVVTCSNGYSESIDESAIEMVTIKSYSTVKPNTDFDINLAGFARSSVNVKSHAEGFSDVLNWLCALPRFDRIGFERLTREVGEQPAIVWKKEPTAEAAIIPQTEENGMDMGQLEKGILLEDSNLFIAWSNFSYLEKIKQVRREQVNLPNTNYRQYRYTIKAPVVLNGIQLKELTFLSPAWQIGKGFNRAWPMVNASANISLGNGGERDYRLLKQHLTAGLGAPKTNESQDFLESQWSGRTSLSIRAWKPNNIAQFYDYCGLYLDYDPDVSAFFRDSYVDSFILDDAISYQVFSGSLQVKADYLTNIATRLMPEALSALLSDDGQFLVWLDSEHSLIGIGNRHFAHIMPLSRIGEWVFVGYYWRDAPRDLSLYFQKGSDTQPTISTGQDNFIGDFKMADEGRWASLLEEIENFVSFPCRFIEDRQYY
ncbi:hypothetical protein [Olivibacter sitiensis]|uniref:hypothetical protein n=1 Tax=Olivibacter sitiensis TaxID=376470 RepID=UPI00048966FF|nr:hypothetical protein [Olivibacter sitiensis]